MTHRPVHTNAHQVQAQRHVRPVDQKVAKTAQERPRRRNGRIALALIGALTTVVTLGTAIIKVILNEQAAQIQKEQARAPRLCPRKKADRHVSAE